MKIKDKIREIKTKFRDNAIASYALDAELICSHALEFPGREDLILNWETSLLPAQITIIEQLVNRRLNHEPMAQILGYREFWEDKFKVTDKVLTPRPETELIIEEALQAVPNTKTALRICDLGTGSGCLAISLAKLYPYAEVTAIDISEEALEVAKENALAINVNNIAFTQSDWFAQIPKTQFDLIVCNPPYIPIADLNNLQKDVTNFEPHLALTDGDQGLNHYKTLATQMRSYMHKKTLAILEFGINQELQIEEIFTTADYNVINFYKDLQGITRGIIVQL